MINTVDISDYMQFNVYDDAGNLLCVITPMAAPLMATKGSTWTDTDAATAPLTQCFRYGYDSYMRLRSKKSPDAAAVKYWYDSTGALVLTQDGSQRSRGVCSFALADSLGRPAVTGECKYSDALVSRVEGAFVVATRSASGSLNGYAPSVSLGTADILSSTYYDDYTHLSLDCFSRLSQKLTKNPLPTHKAAPKGLPTGSWSMLLAAVNTSGLTEATPTFNDSITVAQFGYLESVSSALCYDSRDRLVATASTDHLGGYCLETSTLNNAGMPLTTEFTRRPLYASDAVESHKYTYVYDALGRVSSITLARGTATYKIQANTYDAIGQLSSSAYGNNCLLSYTYKPSGAVSTIEAKNAARTTITFSQKLYYATGSRPSYSGNIGSIDWYGFDKVSRHYDFSYDALGRLVRAAYSEPAGRPLGTAVSGVASYTSDYTYGLDSRPLTVRRLGITEFVPSVSNAIPKFGIIDNLTLSYTGSRLTKVSDSAADVVYTGAADFNDGADSATEYTYDSDGRLLSDANKDITSIKYNVLGLPAVVTFADGSSITNRYSAGGTLLQRVKTEPIKTITPLSLTPVLPAYSKSIVDNHIGALTFRKNALLRINTPTGYFADGAMHYYVKDYQGNIRQVTDADGAVEQDNHYYPYGMLMGESSDILTAVSNANRNPYLYGAKEYLTTAGANLYDFTARTYDPSLPLFHTQDPLASDFTRINPYTFCAGDPVNRVDRDGRLVIFVNGFHFGDGGSAEYWNGVDDIIMDELEDHHALYYDGSNGGHKGLFGNTSSTRRCINGYLDGIDNAGEILNSLEEGETIKFISHSMGASYTEGFIRGMEYYGADINVNIDVIEKIDFELDIAPYQANQQVVHDGVKTFTLQHTGDMVAMPYKIKNAENHIIYTQLLPGIFDMSSHRITSFSEEVKDMIKHIRKSLKHL